MLNIDKIYHGDCLDLMNDIPDKSIDMILCDLPYGTTRLSWDSVIPLPELWARYNKIIKDNGAIVLTATQPFSSALVSSNYKMFRYEWVWVKSRVTGYLSAKKQPMRKTESVLVFYKKQPIYNPKMKQVKERYVSRSGGWSWTAATRAPAWTCACLVCLCGVCGCALIISVRVN